MMWPAHGSHATCCAEFMRIIISYYACAAAAWAPAGWWAGAAAGGTCRLGCRCKCSQSPASGPYRRGSRSAEGRLSVATGILQGALPQGSAIAMREFSYLSTDAARRGGRHRSVDGGSAHLAHSLRFGKFVRVNCLCAIALSFFSMHLAAGCIFLLFSVVCNTYARHTLYPDAACGSWCLAPVDRP